MASISIWYLMLTSSRSNLWMRGCDVWKIKITITSKIIAPKTVENLEALQLASPMQSK